MNNKRIGIKGENEFIKRLNKLGIPYNYLDDWCDFEIYGEPVDVKTCRISQKYKVRGEVRYHIGNFILTDEQLEKDCWFAFFVREKNEYLFLGMKKIKAFQKRKYSLHEIRDMKTISIEEFLSKIRKGDNSA